MEELLFRLSEIAKYNIEYRDNVLKNENYSFERFAYGCTLNNWTIAWNEIINNKNFDRAKQYFNENGLIDLKRIELLNHRVLDMQNTRDNFCCVALSDNAKLINQYSDINYNIKYNLSKNREINISFIDYANKGELVALFSLCVLNAFKKDKLQLEKSLLVFKALLEKKKLARVLLPDYDFLYNLLKGNKDGIKEKIEFFLTKKLHNQRMGDELILKNFISQPAILFLKLSWMFGYEIEIKHKLIPMDLMPIKPLYEYNNIENLL